MPPFFADGAVLMMPGDVLQNLTAGKRLALAGAVSVVLHLVLVLQFAVLGAGGGTPTTSVLQARLGDTEGWVANAAEKRRALGKVTEVMPAPEVPAEKPSAKPLRSPKKTPVRPVREPENKPRNV